MPYTRLNLEEAASFLHLTTADVRALAVHGEIPCEREGERFVFRKGELQPWASRRILGMRGKHLHDYHSKGVLHPHDLSPEASIVTELTIRECLEPSLQARSRAAAIRGMVSLAERSGLLYDPRDLVVELEAREALCSTGIEGGAALLHPRYHDPYMVDDSFICAAVCPQPIPFGAPDGGKTDVFLLICCQDDRTHLHVLTRVCMLCHATGLLNELRSARTPADMFDAIARAERTLAESL